MDHQISVEKLSFSYDLKKVLEQVDMNINKGSFFCLVGPNGSGKSTLLRVISAALKPQEGAVYLEGRNVKDMKNRSVAKMLSFVPQNTSLEFDFKVSDVVLMGRYPHVSKLKGETRADFEMAEKAMEYTNTTHLKDRSFMELSGGERQRVILAQALAQDTDILILDEPVSNLDLQHQVEILNLIKKMCIDRKLTVIAVLHDLNLASAYGDYIIMMKEGKIRRQGTPFETLTASGIKEIFDTDVYVSVSPVGNKPYIYALARPNIDKKGIHVHVICGGGSGSEIIGRLCSEGFDLSSGVLTIGDLDWKISKENNMQVAEEVPFVEISEEAYARNIELAAAADAIVLTGLYLGKSNIRNLELLLEKDMEGKPLFILEDESFTARDYTGGTGLQLYNRIKSGDCAMLTESKILKEEIIKAVRTHGEG
ncbi:MAG: heme ABC transporter ATP-binding protein [Clostridiaceae bacterium]|nr:heme ABC transporter ATP-binding protein [Clostridiaceae bacterium]